MTRPDDRQHGGAAPLAVPFGGPPAAPGSVSIVGGGPGDPGLLTLRAARLLSTCDVVAHDLLSPPEALGLAPPGAEVVCVGRRAGHATISQREVEALLVRRARTGHAVVRLKGGDPFVFGRGAEEAAACVAAGVPCEVVAGVTSAVAAPQAAGIPLTHRGVSSGFTVVTAHEAGGRGCAGMDFDVLARVPGTLVILMGVTKARHISAGLMQHGKPRDTPVALVRWGTTAAQEVLASTLEAYPEEVERSGFASPAVTVVGDVVSLRPQLSQQGDRPAHPALEVAAAAAELAAVPG